MVVVGVLVKVDWGEFGGEGVGSGAGAAHIELGALSKLRLALLSSLLLLNTAFFANSHVGTAAVLYMLQCEVELDAVVAVFVVGAVAFIVTFASSRCLCSSSLAPVRSLS